MQLKQISDLLWLQIEAPHSLHVLLSKVRTLTSSSVKVRPHAPVSISSSLQTVKFEFPNLLPKPSYGIYLFKRLSYPFKRTKIINYINYIEIFGYGDVMETGVVKGFQFKYENFLWLEIVEVRKLERDKDYALALQYAISLVKYLPDGIKEKFEERSRKIRADLRELTANVQAPSLFVKGVVKNRMAQKYTKLALDSFIRDLSSELDKRGYMEKKSIQPRAAGHGRLRIHR